MNNTLPVVVYIICNGIFIERCTVLRETRDLITLRIVSTGQGLRLRRSKIFLSKREAEQAIKNKAYKK